MKNILIRTAKRKTIIIVFANSGYYKVLENWLKAIEKLDIGNFLVISMDQLLFDQLQEKNIPTVLRKCEIDRGEIWIHRINVIKEILDYGYNVVHSDADAVWIKNPLHEYIYDQSYDVIFSQGTYWPIEVHNRWNFVLCCGFFYLSSNEKTLSFVREWMIDVQKTKDDQVSFNKLLMEKKIKWEQPENVYKLYFKDKKFDCSDNIRQGTFDNMRIALLPHSKFQRVADKNQDVYVKHIISEKNSSNILEVLKDNNCFFLNS